VLKGLSLAHYSHCYADPGAGAYAALLDLKSLEILRRHYSGMMLVVISDNRIDTRRWRVDR